MALFDFLRRSGAVQNSGQTTITSINIRLGGDVHSLPGREVSGDFSLDIPFKNRMGNGLLPDNLKGPDITISSISVDRPFELVEIKPDLPRDVAYMSEEKFSLKIRPPKGNYSGPLLIRFDTGSKDSVDVSISGIILAKGTKRVALEGSVSSMNVKRGQVFRRDIQLYKALSFGDKINRIEVGKPFGLVSTEPAAPFTVDVKDSYVMKAFIKCPDFSYAGELEITFT